MPYSTSRQRGAVMAVALILLLVITLVGLSAIQTTGLEERMSANAQFKAIAFNASETVIAEVWNNTAVEGQAYNAWWAGIEPPTHVAETIGSEEITVVATVEYLTETQMILGEGDSSGLSYQDDEQAGGSSSYIYRMYEIQGAANIENANVSNTNVQGFYRSQAQN